MKRHLRSAAALIFANSLMALPAFAQAPKPLFDAHVHIDEHDAAASIALLAGSMAGLGETRVIVQTLPLGPDSPNPWDIEKIVGEIRKYPGKLGVTGGGGTLNPMLVAAYAKGDVGPAAQKRIRARAEEILKLGAVGFGELSNEHFATPTGTVPEYEYYPADFPLMLLMADIAAQHDVPIVLHMEAVPQDMASGLTPPNPPSLHGNFKALENLLAHNRRAKIIWAHAGSDNTGMRTADRMRPLLKANPNLTMELKIDPRAPGKTYLLADGKLKPEWLALLNEFPDRFIIGSDQHYGAADMATLVRIRAEMSMLEQLPPAVRQKIAVDNPARLYNVKGRQP